MRFEGISHVDISARKYTCSGKTISTVHTCIGGSAQLYIYTCRPPPVVESPIKVDAVQINEAELNQRPFERRAILKFSFANSVLLTFLDQMVKCRVISVYTRRAHWTLHRIKCPPEKTRQRFGGLFREILRHYAAIVLWGDFVFVFVEHMPPFIGQ